ncbi:MAG TPA: hypothetical protein VNT79_01565 [Phycisphaerae bacterium]|nr:hypothetical protein [Phycisphaerae bacterium]
MRNGAFDDRRAREVLLSHITFADIRRNILKAHDTGGETQWTSKV